MNDLQIGDKCTVVIDGMIHQGVVTDIASIGTAAQVFIPAENNSGQFMISIIERHPRPMEMIEVWDSDAWIYREAICCEDSGVWVVGEEGKEFFTDWCLISAKEDKAEIIRRIEEDDPDILGELAEIILAARETHITKEKVKP